MLRVSSQHSTVTLPPRVFITNVSGVTAKGSLARFDQKWFLAGLEKALNRQASLLRTPRARPSRFQAAKRLILCRNRGVRVRLVVSWDTEPA